MILQYPMLADSEDLDQTERMDWLNGLADLGFRYPYMPEDTFLHDSAHLTTEIA